MSSLATPLAAKIDDLAVSSIVENVYWRVSNAWDILVRGEDSMIERENKRLFNLALENLLKLREIEETLKK